MVRSYIDGKWIINVERFGNGTIYEEEIQITEEDLRNLLYYLIWNRIRLYDVRDDDILDSDIYPSKILI